MSRIVLTATAYFEDMTWGDLRALVAIGDKYDVPNDADVQIEYTSDDDGYSSTPEGLTIAFIPGGDG